MYKPKFIANGNQSRRGNSFEGFSDNRPSKNARDLENCILFGVPTRPSPPVRTRSFRIKEWAPVWLFTRDFRKRWTTMFPTWRCWTGSAWQWAQWWATHCDVNVMRAQQVMILAKMLKEENDLKSHGARTSRTFLCPLEPSTPQWTNRPPIRPSLRIQWTSRLAKQRQLWTRQRRWTQRWTQALQLLLKFHQMQLGRICIGVGECKLLRYTHSNRMAKEITEGVSCVGIGAIVSCAASQEKNARE